MVLLFINKDYYDYQYILNNYSNQIVFDFTTFDVWIIYTKFNAIYSFIDKVYYDYQYILNHFGICFGVDKLSIYNKIKKKNNFFN